MSPFISLSPSFLDNCFLLITFKKEKRRLCLAEGRICTTWMQWEERRVYKRVIKWAKQRRNKRRCSKGLISGSQNSCYLPCVMMSSWTSSEFVTITSILSGASSAALDVLLSQWIKKYATNEITTQNISIINPDETWVNNSKNCSIIWRAWRIRKLQCTMFFLKFSCQTDDFECLISFKCQIGDRNYLITKLVSQQQ